MYNPKKVKEVVPEANLMCAEQTFAWQSRYKKVHFVLHRLIKGRNRYTSLSYKQNRKLDSIAVPLFTNSETAAATPLGLMRNFQWTINQ